MITNFTLNYNKILGEYFGALENYEYNIGDKLYDTKECTHYIIIIKRNLMKRSLKNG